VTIYFGFVGRGGTPLFTAIILFYEPDYFYLFSTFWALLFDDIDIIAGLLF
jgi:hypothetical protein